MADKLNALLCQLPTKHGSRPVSAGSLEAAEAGALTAVAAGATAEAVVVVVVSLLFGVLLQASNPLVSRASPENPETERMRFIESL